MILIVLLLVSLIVLDQIITSHENIPYYKWIRSLVLLYFGWVQIATLLMTTIYMQYVLGWVDGSSVVWPICVLILA